MPQEGFEPAIHATKRPQTYASDRAATGIGDFNNHALKNEEDYKFYINFDFSFM
jgi:hypothetical protein